jgi:hypothetical protein
VLVRGVAVSCNHNNVIPPDRTILGAELRLRGTRFFGSTPLVNGTRIILDMVRHRDAVPTHSTLMAVCHPFARCCCWFCLRSLFSVLCGLPCACLDVVACSLQ